jgi:predicted TIM-barrel fold metal-dependent hydrolase
MSSSAEASAPAAAARTFPQWVRDVRAPVPPLPPNSCDCQAHIFGERQKYPARSNPNYPVYDASFEDLVKVERTLGFERFVIVHSTLYGTDARLVIDSLATLPDHSHIRVIGRIDDTVSDKELERLDALGFRGVRFNFQPHLPQPPSWPAVARILDRIRGLGWHVRIHVGRDAVLEFSDRFKAIKDIRVVIDHLGYVDIARGVDQPSCRWIVDQLKNDENWWLMASNGNRLSPMESGWDDAVPVARAYIAAAPDRIIWGTDWPHVQWRKQRMMNDAEEVELLYRYVDNDRALLQKILVDNPARLHGFP